MVTFQDGNEVHSSDLSRAGGGTPSLRQIGAATRASTASGDYLPPQPPATQLNPKYGQEETIPGLECSYGKFAYSYSHLLDDNVSARSRRPGCHNPVEGPAERHHCDVCGGDYCSVHADRLAHDCDSITIPES